MAVRRRADAAAFSEFAAVRSRSLFRTAYLVVGDFQLAQDLVQEALIKVYVAWPRLRDVNKAEAYTRRVIVTTAISWRRRRGFHERPVESLPESATGDPTEGVGVQDELWSELRRLPPRQRAAVVLRFCEDLSETQVATLMDCSVGSVKKHTSLGLSKLRNQLGALDVPTPEAQDRSAVIP